MRLRATLTSLTAVTAALAVMAPMAPANAVPVVVGEFVTFTPTVLRTVVPDECRDVASLKTIINLQAVGSEIEKQGYRSSNSDPIYTGLAWDLGYRITGPNNFYATGNDNYNQFPTAESELSVEVCPSDFSNGQVAPGAYAVEAKVLVFDPPYSGNSICSAAEGCQSYPKLYEKTITTSFTLAGEAPPPPSADCVDAAAAVAKFTPLVKKAKALLKKAKSTHKKAKIRKAKRRLLTYKGKLAVARDRVIANC